MVMEVCGCSALWAVEAMMDCRCLRSWAVGDAAGGDGFCRPGVSVPGPEQGGGQFLAAADTELAEYGAEVFLDGVLADGQLADDLLGGVPAQDQGHYLGLGAGYAVAVEDQRCDVAGAGLLEY